MSFPQIITYTIAALATAGVLIRPFKLPEAVWAVAAALAVIALGLLSPIDALHAAGKGSDVYLFLTGMMLLSETARRAGLFDWLAVAAVNQARESIARLFALIYGVGIVVTVFLSNDATAVVLTPAVYAASRRAQAPPLPFLLACAFIANAASFVLPISNPANIVLYGDHTPPLLAWLARFALPSLLSIAATYGVLRYVERKQLSGACLGGLPQPPLSAASVAALSGIVTTAAVLVAVSALDRPLGAPTCIMGVLTATFVVLRERHSPLPLLRDISWSVLPLVAGLFVLVEALNRAGLVQWLSASLQHAAADAPTATAAVAGTLLALLSNLVNNLPAGLIASSTIAQAHPSQTLVDALLIGVDLGPNLSITGSLATILWLTAIRREGEQVSFWTFLRVGVRVMPPALLLAIGARLLLR